MLETLAISESEYTYIWQELQRQQMVFHPTLAPAGRFNSQEFFRSLETKPFSLFIDNYYDFLNESTNYSHRPKCNLVLKGMYIHSTKSCPLCEGL